MPDFTTRPRALGVHHNANAARERARYGQLLCTEQRNVRPAVEARRVRGELADQIRRGGEQRGDDVCRDEVIVVEDGIQHLLHGLPNEDGLICRDGGGTADGPYGAGTLGVAHTTKMPPAARPVHRF